MSVDLPVSHVHFEGSPVLGYLSYEQMHEHVQHSFEVDERRADSIANKVFRQLGIDRPPHIGQGLRHGEMGELIIEPDANRSYSDWEIGWSGTWNELGVFGIGKDHNLLNLDYFVSRYGSGVSELKEHYTQQVAESLGSYIEDRLVFLGDGPVDAMTRAT